MALSRIAIVITAPLRHVRSRIILPFALLTLLLAGAGSYVVTGLVAGSLQERFDRQLVETGRVVADEVVRQEQHQLATVRSMSATEGMAQAVQTEDNRQARTLLEPLIRNAGADIGGAADAQGRVFFATAREPSQQTVYQDATGISGADWWPIQRALLGADQNGDKYASIVESDRGFVIITAAPVYQDGKVVGATFTGTYLDALVEQLKQRSLGDVTLYDYTGRPIASTLIADETRGDALRIDGALLSAIFSSGERSQRSVVSHAERDFDLAYGLLRVRGNVVGVYSIALSSDFVGTTGAKTRLQLSIFVVVAAVAVLMLGFFVSNHITDPILRLASAARRLSAGDTGVRSGVHTSDEIGELAATFDHMAESLEEYAARLRRQFLGTVKALTSAIDARDPYTLGHSVRVGQLGRTIGAQLGLTQTLLGEVEIGGYLHDIGKIGVRDAVLLKPGTLTPEERAAIEQHPAIGASILESVDVSPEVLQMVRGHHERMDGSGYPDGLRGEEQSIVMRIAAVADVYDALMTERPYKPAMNVSDVISVVRAQMGRLLDAEVIEALLVIIPAWEERVRSDPSLQGVSLGDGERIATRRAA
jgi:putative nucleotidyltransferase with HDIG domain